jgi:riboflavin biosynthesis pyrimidine reductase
VLIEGGGITISRFVQAGVVDRLHVTVAPLLIGSGRPALTLTAIESLDQALRPPCRHFRLGQDILFDLDLRHTWPS